MPYWFTSFEFKFSVAERLIENIPEYINYDFGLFYPPWINRITRPIQFVFYLILCAVLLMKFRAKLKLYAGTSKINQYYISVLLSFILIFFLVFNIIFAFLSYQLVVANIDKYLITVLTDLLQISSYFTPLIPLFLLLMPKLVYGFPVSYYPDSTLITTDGNTTVNLNIKADNFLEINKGKPETKIVIQKTDPFQAMSAAITSFFENEKPYIKQGFSVHDVCQHLNAPRHHIQYCLNVIMNKKFADLKNEYRVRHAMELLKSESATANSIEGIGRQSGFSTNANFYISFRNLTGMTPNQWLHQYRLNFSKDKEAGH